MTSSPAMSANAALGVGKIVSDSFSILFKNLIAIVILGFVPSLIGLIISSVFLGASVTLGVPTDDPFPAAGFSAFGVVFSSIIQLAIQGITIALLVQLAYDAKLGRAITPAAYVGPALRNVVPITVLSLVIGILAGIGFMLLIIPGLILYAMYCVTTPAILIDKAGFGAMGRSASLTKEYRWPIIGVLIVLGICTLALSFVITFVIGMIIAALGPGAFGVVAGLVIYALMTAITYGLSGIGAALIYARLRDIKEGVSVDSLADVFD